MFRKVTLALIVAVGLAALGSFIVARSRYPRRELKSCFNDVHGLQAGASVRIAGVDVGAVRRVRASPRNKDCPAEVDMALGTPYEINIPKDSIASIETAGILGPTIVAIDVSQASGGPVENYGYLKSKQSKPAPSVEDHLKALELLLGLAEASKQARQEVPQSKASSPPRGSRH